MAHGGTGPKSLEERYDALVGDEEERTTLFLLWRKGGLRAVEVVEMPWWERRLYVEGLIAETERENDGGD